MVTAPGTPTVFVSVDGRSVETEFQAEAHNASTPVPATDPDTR